MTDDLIARLREPADWAIERPLVELREEAADRIEALETQNEGYNLALAEQLQIRQELEIEAAENARIIGMSAEREMALRGEVERLRDALDRCRASNAVMDNTVERLREALRRIDTSKYDGLEVHRVSARQCHRIARAALKGTSDE